MLEETRKAYEAVIAQGAPSMNSEGSCLYRGPNGLKCAAGHAIPDEIYQETMEGHRFVYLFNGSPELRKVISNDLFEELIHLQSAHDTAAMSVMIDKVTNEQFVEEFKEQVARYL